MSFVPDSAPLTPFILCRRKPQAKFLSPVSRNLFGSSDPSVVKDMLCEVLMTERRKAKSKLNFDVYYEKPLETEVQENISDIDKTPESQGRYLWKSLKAGEAPDFYTRRHKVKKSLLPSNISNCSPELPAGQSNCIPKNLHGHVRSPSSDMKSRPVSSPLRPIPAEANINEPSSFDESLRCEFSTALPKPLAVHAATESALTAKVLSPSRDRVACRLIQRSPLTLRENQSTISTVPDFDSTPKRSFGKTSRKSEESISNGSWVTSQNSVNLPSRDCLLTATPKKSSSAHSAMKQLKITDMTTVRKHRSPAVKARKRLRLLDDNAVNFSSPKSQKMTNRESA